MRDKLFQKCRGRRRVYTENTEHTPNRDDVSTAILQHLDGLRGIDTHCHHLPDDQFQNMGVKFLYDHSYCNWMDDLLGLLHSYSNWMDTYPDDAQEVPEFLLQNSGNSYFYWLRCAISDLYNLPVNAANLNELDRTIAKAYEDPNHQLRILEEQCRYDRILLDNYTHPGQVESTGKLFVPVLRCNMFAVCNCKSRIDHNGNNPSMYIPDVYERNFDDYLERIRQYILQYRVLKFAIAYDEGNRVRNFDKSRAAVAYGQENPTEAAYRDFYEYMVYYICRLAGEHGLVVQIHTGLGNMDETN